MRPASLTLTESQLPLCYPDILELFRCIRAIRNQTLNYDLVRQTIINRKDKSDFSQYNGRTFGD
jgi:hypothetical protein